MGTPYIMKKGVSELADLIDGFSGFVGPMKEHYYVDGRVGDDSNDGLRPDEPFATIGAARTANTARINATTWTNPQRAVIWVAPYVYDESLGGFYYCDVIGLGIRGTDQMAEWHPTEGSCIDGDATILGARFINLRFEVDEAVECIDGGIVNSSKFLACTFTNGANVAAWGISTTTSTHLTVANCNFESGQLTGLTYGIYNGGGANKFAHNNRYFGNRIFASVAGIYVAANCTNSQMVIGPGNFIGPAACLKGIDDNAGGSYVYGNYISAVDAIEHANSATQCVDNRVVNDGTGAKETTGT